MANKKINELVTRTPSLTDLILVGDPSSGYSYKATVTALATIIETDIADGFVTLSTTQTISGAKTFSNIITATSVANTPTDPDKFLTLNASNQVTYRTGAEVLSDIGAASSGSISGTTNYVAKFISSSAIGNSVIYSNTSGNVSIGNTNDAYKLDVSGTVRSTSNFVVNNGTVVGNFAIESSQVQIGTPLSHPFVIFTNNTERLRIDTSGNITFSQIANATIDTDKFLVSDSGVIKYRTGAEVLSDIGAASSSNISGTTNYIAKFTSGSAIGNSVIYESGGNIGIGTTTLTATLTVNGNAILNGSINATETYLSSPNGLVFQINSTNANGGYAEFQTSSTTIGRIGTATQVVGSGGASVFAISSVGANDFILGTNGTQRVRIDTSGNVTFSQIANATTDTDKFLVSDSGVLKYRTGSELLSDIGGASSSSISGTTNYIPKFTGANSLGNSILQDNGSVVTVGGALTVSSANINLSNSYSLSARNNANTTYISLIQRNTSDKVLIDADGYGSVFGGTVNAYSYDGTTNNIFTVSGSEGMRLTSTGLGIGTSSPAYKLDVTGQIRATNTINTDDGYYSSKAGSDVVASGAYIQFTNAAFIQANATNGLDFWTLPTGGGGWTRRMTLSNSGNLGLGVTPSAWGSIFAGGVLQVKNSSLLGYLNNTYLSANAYFTNSSDNYIASDYATRYVQASGQHRWETAPSGTAGNAISFTQAMTLNASGRLLVGTTTASGATILGKALSSSNITLEGLETGGVHSIYIRPNNSGYNLISSNYFSGSSYLPLSLSARENNADFVLSTTGNVGIGTTSPTGLFTSYKSQNGDPILGHFYNDNAGTSTEATVYITNGATTSEGLFLQTLGTGFTTIGGFVQDGSVVGTGTGVSGGLSIMTRANADMRFYTNGHTNERMRITSGGDLCVGTTSTSNGCLINFYKASGSITTILGGTTSAQNHIVFANPNGNVGSIQVSGSATSYNTSSDYRLKQDFKDFNGLDLLTKIKTYDYEWKADKSRSYGVIAHELQLVINYAVTGVKDGEMMQGVDYSKIVPILIKSIQELKAEIETLKIK